MCLSNVYNQKIDEEHLLLKNVQSIRAEDGRLFFTDLLEREHEFEGVIVSADLINGSVVINMGRD